MSEAGKPRPSGRGAVTTVTNIILRALPMTPEKALTVSEVVAATGMTSYNVSGKLSKLAAYGTIRTVRAKGERHRYWTDEPPPPSPPLPTVPAIAQSLSIAINNS